MPYDRRHAMLAAISGLAIGGLQGAGSASSATDKAASAGYKAGRRILFHVASDDPKSMSHTVGSADNAMKFYAARGEPVAIVIVSNGAGVRMMRADSSPIAPAIAYLHKAYPALLLSACGVTLGLMRAHENQPILLLDGVRVTPVGIARIVELQDQGWAYVRS